MPSNLSTTIVMSGNTFGKLFTLTTAGESHGDALIGIVDGCPPGMSLTEKDLQDDLCLLYTSDAADE